MKKLPLSRFRAFRAFRCSLIASLLLIGVLHAEPRHALIVGCDYKGTSLELPSPVKDAKALASELQKVGFPSPNITLLSNPTRQQLIAAADKFHEQLKASGGVGLFYFSGHGAQVEGANYLIPAKAAVKFREHLPTEGLSANYISTNMEAADNGINILILDACRNNPLPSAKKKAFAKKGLAQMSGNGILFCFASKDGQEALDTGTGSVYTNAFIKHLSTPNLSVYNLLTRVRKDVKARTDGAQEPFFYSGLDDPFSFLSSTTPAIRVPEIPTAPQITASKSAPFQNSLKMKFVSIPITGGPTDGKKILFSIWETRRMDYEAFSKANSGVDEEWRKAEYNGKQVGHEPTHPVVNVNWIDANAFCAWLTRKERASGAIGPKDEYRLPTDHEWSCAVGIGTQEDPTASPESKSGKIESYPWGKTWPPPVGAGNFDSDDIEGYSDTHELTSPVGSYRVDKNGLYDIIGNVWEWCEDTYSAEQTFYVMRGKSWVDAREGGLASSCRQGFISSIRFSFLGFRCVLVVTDG